MQAMSLGALPRNAGATATAVAVLADELAFLSGDRSTDLAWYGKRGLIAGIYASTGRKPPRETLHCTCVCKMLGATIYVASLVPGFSYQAFLIRTCFLGTKRKKWCIPRLFSRQFSYGTAIVQYSSKYKPFPSHLIGREPIVPFSDWSRRAQRYITYYRKSASRVGFHQVLAKQHHAGFWAKKGTHPVQSVPHRGTVCA